MKNSLLTRIKPEYLKKINDYSCYYTKESTKLILDEHYHIMFLPFVALINLRDILNIQISILNIESLFNEPEKI